MTQQDNKVLACVDQSPYADHVTDYAAWAARRIGGPAAQLPPLPVQYIDYVHWQREVLAGHLQRRDPVGQPGFHLVHVDVLHLYLNLNAPSSLSKNGCDTSLLLKISQQAHLIQEVNSALKQ